MFLFLARLLKTNKSHHGTSIIATYNKVAVCCILLKVDIKHNGKVLSTTNKKRTTIWDAFPTVPCETMIRHLTLTAFALVAKKKYRHLIQHNDDPKMTGVNK